jgi:hypothetical protein
MKIGFSVPVFALGQLQRIMIDCVTSQARQSNVHERTFFKSAPKWQIIHRRGVLVEKRI